MKFIHLDCLRSWTDNKKHYQGEGGVDSFYWENLICELCKTPLQLEFQIFNPETGQFKHTKLLEYSVPIGCAYMVIESDIECPSKAIHIVDFTFKDQYFVGRRVNNEISISDISVSRQQASFTYERDCIFMADLNSKFGTFLKVEGIFEIPRTTQTTVIQIEKKCFFFNMVERFTKMEQCCFFCMKNYPFEDFDHYHNVHNKFPGVIRSIIAPELHEIMVERNRTEHRRKKSKDRKKKTKSSS